MGAGVIKHHSCHTGLNQARADSVHPDIVIAKITRSGHGEVDHSSLRGAIGIASCARADTSNRGCIDNGTEFASLHVRRDMLDEQHCANQINRQHLVPLVSLVFGYRWIAVPCTGNASDVAQDVDFPVSAYSFAYQVFDLSLIGNVDNATEVLNALR